MVPLFTLTMDADPGILVRDVEPAPVMRDVELFRIGTARQHPGDPPCRDVDHRDSVLGLVGLQLLAFLVGHAGGHLGDPLSAT